MMIEPYRLLLPMPPRLSDYYENAKRVVKGGPNAGKQYTGRMISAEGLAFRTRVVQIVRAGHRSPPKLQGRLHIICLVEKPTHDKVGRKLPLLKGDLDNLWKCLLDALTKADVIGDDVQFDHIEKIRGNARGDGRISLCISQFDPDASLARATAFGLPLPVSPGMEPRSDSLPF